MLCWAHRGRVYLVKVTDPAAVLGCLLCWVLRGRVYLVKVTDPAALLECLLRWVLRGIIQIGISKWYRYSILTAFKCI